MGKLIDIGQLRRHDLLRSTVKAARVARKLVIDAIKLDDGTITCCSDLSLMGACGEASLIISRIMGRLDFFSSGEWKGHGHCWVTLPNGIIVDATATQFGIKEAVHVARPGTVEHRAYEYDREPHEYRADMYRKIHARIVKGGCKSVKFDTVREAFTRHTFEPSFQHYADMRLGLIKKKGAA